MEATIVWSVLEANVAGAEQRIYRFGFDHSLHAPKRDRRASWEAQALVHNLKSDYSDVPALQALRIAAIFFSARSRNA